MIFDCKCSLLFRHAKIDGKSEGEKKQPISHDVKPGTCDGEDRKDQRERGHSARDEVYVAFTLGALFLQRQLSAAEAA